MEPPPDCSSCYIPGGGNNSETSIENHSAKEITRRDSDGDFLDLTKGKTVRSSRITEGNKSVRSKAVIAYSATEKNAVFSKLAPKTDLNLAPSNWLRKTVGLRPESVLPGSRYTASPQRPFSGFSMANSHLDCVGKVDVVSDAENVKKLLMMPYSKAHVSMAIHRIGRTLLLENFDIRKYTAEESEWQWFRDFYHKLLEQKGAETNRLFKKKSPSSQHDRLMLSKFLYYSIYNDSFNKLEGKPESSAAVHIEQDGTETDGSIKLVEIEEKFEALSSEQKEKIQEVAASLPKGEEKQDQVVLSDKRWRYKTPRDTTQAQASPEEVFERNISWTFEDLKMMLGTNMPIFGGGKYPAVSLRLRDSNKPINILTGIDYWLDNLICNVPELVMCFHVNGIVQNYEVIKTEDIPKLKNSSFSPQVVKDIAQNILSFLKSNCTKEGHTYWLFKGSDDDVVKLYDLTTLYSTTTAEASSSGKSCQQNPYIFSVAMLLYKTAVNLMQSKDTCDHHITVKKLLVQCVDLLDKTEYPYIVSSAICMLSTLCLPDPGLDRPSKDSAQPSKETDSTSVDWESCDTCTSLCDAEQGKSRKTSEEPRNVEIASIPSVTDLSIPEKYQFTSFDIMRSPSSRARRRRISDTVDQAGQVDEGCKNSLSYIVSGFDILMQNSKHPFEDWQKDRLQQLTRNSALAYFRLAEQASNVSRFGGALRRSDLALQSYETYDYLTVGGFPSHSVEDPSQAIPPDFHLLLPKLLSLCGQVQFGIVQDIRSHGAVSLSHREDYASSMEDDEKIRDALNVVLKTEGKYQKMTQITNELDEALKKCAHCYEMALEVLRGITEDNMTDHSAQLASCDVKPKSKNKAKKGAEVLSAANRTESRESDTVNRFKATLRRRHGHVINELGASALNRAVQSLSDDGIGTGSEPSSHKAWDTWNEANSYFETAYRAFVEVNDVINQALVLSNLGRLMRVSAQLYSNREEGQLSQRERKCFSSAIEKYQKALTLLGPGEKRSCQSKTNAGVSTCVSVHDNISWELSSSYFAMAQILQDNAPQEQKESEEAEKEVISLLTDSLKYCKHIWEKTPKQSMSAHRQAKIHHRIASLHHNSYRNCTDGHKSKQLRNLADKLYAKSVAALENLEHPIELLRIMLERLALKERHIASLTNVKHKIKHLLEVLEMTCECVKPLKLIQSSTKVATKNTSADGAKRTSSTSVVDDTNAEEVSNLLRILATIVQSVLLSLVKLTSNFNCNENQDSKKAKSREIHTVVKELCGLALRTLHPIKAENCGNVENICTRLQGSLMLMIEVLNEVNESAVCD